MTIPTIEHHMCITYDAGMRTTITLPDHTYEIIKKLAAEQGRSISSMIADLTIRGLASRNQPAELIPHPITGIHALPIGRTITDDDVAELLDDE